MTDYISRNLNQTCTYWGSPTKNGYGGFTFASPVQISCRWENRDEVYYDDEGKEKRGSAAVYVAQELEADGWLYLGTSTASDPSSVEGAFPIKVFRLVPNLKGTLFEARAIL